MDGPKSNAGVPLPGLGVDVIDALDWHLPRVLRPPMAGILGPMPSFDVVSEVDLQEVRNAVDQASRELLTRYDFKGTDSTAHLGEHEVAVESSTDHRLVAAVQVMREKLARRKVPQKAISGGEPHEIGGGRYRAVFKLNQGIEQEAAKELVKVIKGTKLKVQAAVQGDSVRVSGKNRDDLQEVITTLKALDFRLPLQFVNFRD